MIILDDVYAKLLKYTHVSFSYEKTKPAPCLPSFSSMSNRLEAAAAAGSLATYAGRRPSCPVIPDS